MLNVNFNTNLNNVTNINQDICVSKEGKLEFELPVIEDKIVCGNKKFDNLREAVEYLVKQSYQYSYNIKIQNINFTPTKIHVITTFNYQEPTIVTKTIKLIHTYVDNVPVYKFDNNYFSDRQEAVRYVINKLYGNYKDLKIIEVSFNNLYANITVEFLDIPDM